MSAPGDGYDYFAGTSVPTSLSPQPGPPAAYPVPGAGADLSRYAPHEQAALLMARSTSLRNMRSGRSRMSFLGRVQTGVALAGTCGRVLRDAPSLMVAPLLALVGGGLSVAIWASVLGGFDQVLADGDSLMVMKAFPLLAVLNVVAVLAQAVVVDGATAQLQLGRASLGRSWATALGRLPDLVFLGLLVAVERTLAGLLRGRKLGDLVAGLFDDAWDFATFLAVPVVLYEGAGPLTSVKRSAQLVRTRWASQFVAGGALDLAVFVLSLPLLVAAALVGWTVTPALAVALVLGAVVLVVVISSALSGVLSAAMYRYAVTGEVGEGFTEGDLWQLFRARGQQAGAREE